MALSDDCRRLASGELIAKQFRRLRGVEAEIAFLLGKDLPPRAAPHSREELVIAIASCHPAIELLESALLNPIPRIGSRRLRICNRMAVSLPALQFPVGRISTSPAKARR
jgi:2-keto-4-pentenoate hydratase